MLPALSQRLDALEEHVVALKAKKSKGGTSERLAEQQFLLSMRSAVLLLASIAIAVVLACMAAVLAAVPGAAHTTTVTLVGAGDIASCNYTQDSATARLLGSIPRTVFTLGDNVYPDGTAWQFRNCYKPT